MKKTHSFLTWLVITLLIAFSSACSKTGPTGSAGATGPQGPQGPQGNANVFVDTFTVNNSGWIWNSQYEYSTSAISTTSYFTRYHDQAFSKLTKGMLDTGQVMVYFTPNNDNANQWAPLPYTFLSFGSQYYYVFAFETMIGKLRLHYFYLPNGPGGTTPDLTTRSTEVLPTHRYKIVVVGATVSTSMAHDQVNFRNYNEVSNYLGLQ